MSDDYWDDPDEMRAEYQRVMKAAKETSEKVSDAEKYAAFSWMRLTHLLRSDHGYCRFHSTRFVSYTVRRACGDCQPVTEHNEDEITNIHTLQEYMWHLLKVLGIKTQITEVMSDD